MMTEKFKILANFIKDASSETPDIETYLFVKEIISKYLLSILLFTEPFYQFFHHQIDESVNEVLLDLRAHLYLLTPYILFLIQ